MATLFIIGLVNSQIKGHAGRLRWNNNDDRG